MPRITAILVGVGGLLLLTWITVVFRHEVIEIDLTERVGQALESQAITDLTIQASGRDLKLSGEIPPQITPQAVADIARDVWGVRVADISAVVQRAADVDSSEQRAAEAAQRAAEAEAAQRAAEAEAAQRAAEAEAAQRAAEAEAAQRAAEAEAAQRAAEAEAAQRAAEAEAAQRAAEAAAAAQSEDEALDATFDTGHITRLSGDLAEALDAQTCQQRMADIASTRPILFETGSASPKLDSYPVLNDLAAAAYQCPQTRLVIGGHTDNSGDQQLNRRLSQARADAVQRFFNLAGIDAERMQTVAHGDSQPVASNDTPEGRAANRRITFDVQPIE